MADTLGSLIDKLATVNQKMFVNQELIYEIRRMSFEQFVAVFLTDPTDVKRLYEGLHKCCDLNLQRNQLIEEVDAKFLEVVRDGGAEKHLQRAHKTYQCE